MLYGGGYTPNNKGVPQVRLGRRGQWDEISGEFYAQRQDISKTSLHTPRVRTPAAPQIDLLALIRDGTHFVEPRPPYLHIVEISTGRTVAVQHQDNPGGALVPQQLPDGTTMWVPDDHKPVAYTVRETLYSPLVIDVICEEIANGGNLTDICKKPHMPTYSTLCRWRRKYPEIDPLLDLARRDRAEFLRDKALKEISGDLHPREVEGKRLKTDIYWKAAGVDDSRYSPKAKVEANINMPTQIVVETGIRREEREAVQLPTEGTDDPKG